MVTLEIKGMESMSDDELRQHDGGFLPIVVRLAIGVVHAYVKTPAGQATIAKVGAAASGGFGAGMFVKELID